MASEKYVKARDHNEEATHDHGIPCRVRLKPALERHQVARDILGFHALAEPNVRHAEGEPVEKPTNCCLRRRARSDARPTREPAAGEMNVQR